MTVTTEGYITNPHSHLKLNWISEPQTWIQKWLSLLWWFLSSTSWLLSHFRVFSPVGAFDCCATGKIRPNLNWNCGDCQSNRLAKIDGLNRRDFSVESNRRWRRWWKTEWTMTQQLGGTRQLGLAKNGKTLHTLLINRQIRSLAWISTKSGWSSVRSW